MVDVDLWKVSSDEGQCCTSSPLAYVNLRSINGDLKIIITAQKQKLKIKGHC